MLRPFGGKLPKDSLSESYEPLTKRSASDSGPWGESVFASDACVEKKRYMFEQPTADWMLDWQTTANPLLNA